jgi:hypothetical protein
VTKKSDSTNRKIYIDSTANLDFVLPNEQPEFKDILGDKTVNGGNVLTGKILKDLPRHDGAKVIYGETCRLGAERLKKEKIVFKQTPYDVKAR